MDQVLKSKSILFNKQVTRFDSFNLFTQSSLIYLITSYLILNPTSNSYNLINSKQRMMLIESRNLRTAIAYLWKQIKGNDIIVLSQALSIESKTIGVEEATAMKIKERW